MNMANENTLPLYDKIWLKYTFSRVMDSFTLLFLLLILGYRIFYDKNHSIPCVLALLCESWFTFTWILTMSTKWSPARTITHLDRLMLRVSESELPALDLFVTTADPVLEPPIITVNTVLSLLALDYPANKLACYVSDDGCSPLTFYALQEATKFAKHWVPFCKKYNVQVRAPFRYFSDEDNVSNTEDSPEFYQDRLRMKEEYEFLKGKIENAAQNSVPLVGELAIFSNKNQKNHSTIIKVIWENKENIVDGLPHVIYISREKRLGHPHQYKAGAMNVLTRVSGLMTNAPFILNLDCDMHVNNPKIALHAMCILLDPKRYKEVAFVQCPQQFYDGIRDDPFGNQLVALFVYIGGGYGGLQGIFYAGTNCFHRRKVFYGFCPAHYIQNGNKDGEMEVTFGTSKIFAKSATHALEGKILTLNDNLRNSLKDATKVASCEYEHDTAWGKQVGWLYGSTSEDVLTGLNIHTRGWRSEICSSDPISFKGCSPQDNIINMIQQKRWASGLFEILLNEHNPIFGFLYGKLQFRQALAYLWFLSWAVRSIPEICYAALPAYCILTNSSFLPKKLWIHTFLFVTYNISTLSESLKTGLSITTWWNNQRMMRINTMSSWFFGFLTVLLKLLRISEPVFEITKKNESSSGDDRFSFNESSIFLLSTTILFVQLTSLVTSFFEYASRIRSELEYGYGEVLCSAYLVVCYLPFLKGLFRTGKHGIPLSTIFKSAILSFIFVHLCKLTIMV
ncbi:cellulose synthase-like protein H1 isoform X2 [Vicia villosa]|uniref:cellulose synthase-like protein H1 isoform X2 n=1 Tax=Vicia villosa TaxID=3911 RepID=UPI00273AF568|nr:cellulose synthase-like protein H1 isoform X2 [Vicia villosa]